MKPKEFDELVRHKFDQGGFAYKPGNWDKMAEQLDGRAKKRSMIMWWLLPVAGMAASVVMAMGVIFLSRLQGSIAPTATVAYAHNHHFTESDAPMVAMLDNVPVSQSHFKTKNDHIAVSVKDNTDKWFSINLQNATASNSTTVKSYDLLTQKLPLAKIKTVIQEEQHATFKPQDEDKKVPKISIILSGGINHGNMNSGYIAGATIRRMVNDKVYVESDLGFASSNNTQSTESVATTSRYVSASAASRGANTSAKISSTESTSSDGKIETFTTTDQYNISYNLYYAQVSPSIGYKVTKRMSIGAGPDFQRMLADNRPTPSPTDPQYIQVAPLFDVGFIGKTEYSVTKKIKAAVYYRKGVNDLITPTDKYIDRNYLQFQLKCVIFNK